MRHALLRAAALAGIVVVVGTEILSARHALAGPGIAMVWVVLVPVFLSSVVAHRSSGLRGLRDAPLLERGLLGAVVAIALVLLVLAALTPPQNPDALGYHMGRILHWRQHQSLEHYPTHDERQLFSPPFAEIVRLHLQVLTGGDRLGGLLQWAAMFLAVAGVSLVAADLGGSRRAQIFAAVVAATLPTGVLLASSGKNEWVVALWLVAYAHFLYRTHVSGSSGDAALAGAALGLAVLTKLTAWFCAVPLLAAFALAAVPKRRAAGARTLFVIAAVAAGLTAPHAIRNLRLYGHPLGDEAMGLRFSVRPVTPATALSGLVRAAAPHLALPSDRANAALTRAVTAMHGWLGLDPQDARFTTPPGSFAVGRTPPSRDGAANLGAMVLMAVSVCAVAASARRRERRLQVFAACLALGYMAYAADVKWMSETVRIDLPMFVLAAPIVGVGLGALTGAAGTGAAAAVAGLLALALPYLLIAEGRPLVGRGNVFRTAPRDLIFARCGGLQSEYTRVAETIAARGWHAVGLDFGGETAVSEYALVVLLRERHVDVRLEHVNVRGPSAVLASSPPWGDFAPDAILFVLDAPRGRDRFPVSLVHAAASYGLLESLGRVALYAREDETQRTARLARTFATLAQRLKRRQQADGSWRTFRTTTRTYDDAVPEVSVLIPSIVGDLLEPIACEAGLGDALRRARGFLRAQIEESGLVRYYGRQDGSTSRRSAPIPPDTDDTALVWRFAAPDEAARREDLRRALAAVRTEKGLYRTWHGAAGTRPPDRDVPDAVVQIHLYRLLARIDAPAATALCPALREALNDDGHWIYYKEAPLVPLLREADLAAEGCPVTIPERRLVEKDGDTDLALARLLRDLRTGRAVAWGAVLDGLDHAAAQRRPLLLYHNDLRVARKPWYYWSPDVTDALWMRTYAEAARRWPERLSLPPCQRSRTSVITMKNTIKATRIAPRIFQTL